MDKKGASGYTPATGRDIWFWLGLCLYVVAISLYFVGRYAGMWSENDSAVLSGAIRAVTASGHLVPAHGYVYSNGYAYQAISAFILALTGLDVGTLQQEIYPLTAVIVVFPALLAYRELTGNLRLAALTTMLLFTQPEFLFVVLRSSHEKFSRMLMFLALYFLLRSLRLSKQPTLYARYVALFYITIATLVTVNNLLAISFILTITVAFGLAWPLQRWVGGPLAEEMFAIRRVFYILMTCLAIGFAFTFYAYPPAESNILLLKGAWRQLATLLFNGQSGTVNPYSQINVGWISLPVYLLVSIGDWIVLLSSIVIWLQQGFTWIVRRRPPTSSLPWLLWLLYTATALESVLSVAADRAGAIAGSNVEVRVLPSFSMIAVALVSTAVYHWSRFSQAQVLRLAMGLGLGIVAALSVIKATNEPYLSNIWTFYRPPEIQAMQWMDGHLHNTEVWVENDERLGTAYLMVHGDSQNGNLFRSGRVRPAMHTFLLTQITQFRAIRLHQPLPVSSYSLRIYDNGTSQVFHARPQTPFQP
jgi:hypothetical protein